MDTHIDGTKQGKVIFYSLLLGFLLVMLLLDNFNNLFPVEGTQTQKIDINIERNFSFNIINTIIHIAYSFIVIYMGRLIIKCGRFPPKGMSVPYRIKITYINSPIKVWLVVGVLLVMFAVNIFSGFYEWYVINELWDGIKKDG